MRAQIVAGLFSASIALTACEKEQPAEPAPQAADTPAAPQPADAWPRYQAVHDKIGKERIPGLASVDIAAGSPRISTAGAQQGHSWPQIANALAAAQPAVQEVIDASALDQAAFPTSNPEVLSTLRQLARVLYVDAARVLAAGDADGAAARLAAIVGISRQAAQPRDPLCSLTGAAIFALAESGVRGLFGEAPEDRLSPAQRARLDAEVARLSPEDPFGARAAGTDEGAPVREAYQRLRARVQK